MKINIMSLRIIAILTLLVSIAYWYVLVYKTDFIIIGSTYLNIYNLVQTFSFLFSFITLIATAFPFFKKQWFMFCTIVILATSISVLVFFPPNYDQILANQDRTIETQNIKEITWDELKELENKSDHNRLVYVGREDCPTCQKFKPEIAAVAYNNDFIVYYYNTTKDRQEADFDDKIKQLTIDRVPSVLIVGKGKVTNITDKIKDSEELDAKFEYLDENKGKLFK